jgi:Flp pilus assembly protein TadG
MFKLRTFEPALFRRFWSLCQDRRGGVALIFALSLPPLMLMAVAGVDLQRAAAVRQGLQDSLDAAALAAARSSETTDAGVRQVGMRVLAASLAQHGYVELQTLAADTSFDLNDDGSVTAHATARVDTVVAGLLFGDSLDVRAEATVMRSGGELEIALVIDNTGSMSSQGRLTAARSAAIDLVEQFQASNTSSDTVRISLVPFSDTVRVHQGFSATGNVSAANRLSWLSQSPNHTGSTGSTGVFSSGANRFQLLDRMRIGWGGCIESRPYPYDVRDTAPTSGDQATMFVPYFSPDTPDADQIDDSTWRRYDRYNDYINEDATGIAGILTQIQNRLTNTLRRQAWSGLLRDVTKYTYARRRSGIGTGLGPNQGCGLEPVVRLTNDFDSVIDAIDAMEATGTTNVPMGLVWGWHTLSPNAPFADGVAYSDRSVRKIVVLLTDGDNVNNTASNPDNSDYTGVGMIWQERLGSDIDESSSSGDRTDRLDERFTELCANMNDQGVTIYTIGVQVSSSSQRLLRSCAGADDRFFNVTNSSGIASAFAQIANSIDRIRIAR